MDRCVDIVIVKQTKVWTVLGSGLYVDTSGLTHTRRWILLSHPDWLVDICRVKHTGV